MRDDELVVIFCHPKTAIEFLGGEDAEVIENCIVMSPLLPKDEVTVVPRDEFRQGLKGHKG